MCALQPHTSCEQPKNTHHKQLIAFMCTHATPTACETRAPGRTGDKSAPWYVAAQPWAGPTHDCARVAPSCTHPRHTRATPYWKTGAGLGWGAVALQRRSTPPCVPKAVKNPRLENGKRIKVYGLATAIQILVKSNMGPENWSLERSPEMQPRRQS